MKRNKFLPLTLELSLLLLCALSLQAQAPITRNYAVEISASVQVSPPQIALSWVADSRAVSYTVSRRTSATDGWTQLAVLPGSSTSFTDNNVTVGAPYEYQILKPTNFNPPFVGAGYIYSGINVFLTDYHGKVILVVVNTYAADLAAELARLQQDLVGDGWDVIRHDIPPDMAVSDLRSLIAADYQADPANVKSLFLFGHAPVAYSGDIDPDGHPNHKGAWPADVYFADVDGTWTDNSVSTTNAERKVNWNIPGDGKFDQSEIPSPVELQMGRVDLSNLTSFSNKPSPRFEKDLLRQYLNKDHAFRRRLFTIERRGLLLDLAGVKEGGSLADSGWRNFSTFFGPTTTELQGGGYFETLRTQGYLWSYAAGGGGYSASDGVGSADDLATSDIQTVFTMMIGSYFGDWNNESNFLRSILGSTSYTLTTAFSGYPHTFYHHMALGETIGYSTKISQNNTTNGPYFPAQQGTRQVHIALMGDPTLRMHPVLPPAGLNATASGAGMSLTWSPSGDSGIAGYHVYRASSPVGPYARLTLRMTTNPNYTDTSGNSSFTYMVRAVKLEQSASGTYYNPSEGIFFPDWLASGNPPPPPPPEALHLAGQIQSGILKLNLTGTAGQKFILETSPDITTWTPLITNQVSGNGFSYTESNPANSGRRFYRSKSIP